MTSTPLDASWTHFLSQQGYQFNGVANTLPTAADAASGAQLIPLTHYTAFTLNGADGEKFLQGQTSCNIDKLSIDHSLLGINANPKGNVINFFRLMKVADQQLLLRFPHDLAANAAANFNKYIVFSKAEFKPADQQWRGIGLQGLEAERVLQKQFTEVPTQPNQQTIVDQALIIRSQGVIPRFELWLPADQAEALWLTLSAEVTLAATQDWLLQDSAAGIAIIDQHTQEEYVPQMLNLHMIDAIDFRKGCYTGQEIITRLQYRGKLSKCLFRGELTAESQPKVGSKVWSSERQQAGEITAVIAKDDRTVEVQMILNIKSATGTLRLDDENGELIHPLPLPYEVDPEWRP